MSKQPKCAVEIVEHNVIQYHDDTEGDRKGFCSVIRSANRLHQIDVMGTQFSDYRWRLFMKDSHGSLTLVDSDNVATFNDASYEALGAYVRASQQTS